MSWSRIQEGWKRVSGGTKEALGDLAKGRFGVLQGGHVFEERDRTNESLRVEREKTDEAVAVRQRNVARDADDIVDRARDNADSVIGVARRTADAVLDAARAKADDQLDPAAGGPARDSVSEERTLADEALRGEREDADEALRLEREDYARTLSRFLPLERETTDRTLKSERIRSDDALASRDDFLAIVAHDLRDLIGGIVMSSALLSKEASPGDQRGRSTLAETKRIDRYAARMNRLIGDLVDIASVDAGKLSVTPAPNDLGIVVAEAEESFRASAAAKGISLSSRVAAAPLPAAFDHGRILQVLANLVSNALKFTPEGGSITIWAGREGGQLHVAVEDSGSGIPPDALESVFERFSQVGGNDRRGLGLGLYIARCLVDAHGGKIWAERRPEGGTRISFRLPTSLGSA
jgi:signal transduction histidine kinase